MIDFKPFDPARREEYMPYVRTAVHRGCACSFANLFLWGRQQAAFLGERMVVHSHFDGFDMYPFPMGTGEVKPALDALMEDARARGIPFRLSNLTQEDAQTIEELYPGRFRLHCVRNSFDYVYDIHDLAELKGRKYQPKRNHLNRFRDACPNHRLEPLTEERIPQARAFAEQWYTLRLQENPEEDLEMERTAMERCFLHYEELEMLGLVLMDGEEILALTIASFLTPDTLDVHFEKALTRVPGTYAAINNGLARYILDKHPQVRYLNREDDTGSPGLRQAKLSYHPHHMVEKYMAVLHD